MLNKQFRFIATTGRTASHFFDVLFSSHCHQVHVASYHGNLPKRLKTAGRYTAQRCINNYALNIMLQNPHAETYIECNGAFLEYISLSYGIKDGGNVIGDSFASPPKSILLTRHPHGYVRSVLAKSWMWNWWKLPHFESVYCKRAQWNKWGPLEKAAHAWRMKSKFFLGLTADDDSCIIIKYENLFSKGNATYIREIKKVCEHFGIQLLINNEALVGLRHKKVESKGSDQIKLTVAQCNKIDNICSEVMKALGYV